MSVVGGEAEVLAYLSGLLLVANTGSGSGQQPGALALQVVQRPGIQTSRVETLNTRAQTRVNKTEEGEGSRGRTGCRTKIHGPIQWRQTFKLSDSQRATDPQQVRVFFAERRIIGEGLVLRTALAGDDHR
ncbi:MAG: hypothetical protein V3T65_00355, partial [Acidobacteriota bacterium]